MTVTTRIRLLLHLTMSLMMKDEMSDAHAAGAVNGTKSTDGIYTRNVTDTAGTGISIASGHATMIGDGTWGHTGMWYTPVLVRKRGLVLAWTVQWPSGTAGTLDFGISSSGSANFAGFDNRGLAITPTAQVAARRTTAGNSPSIYNVTLATDHRFYNIHRNQGRFILAKAGGVTKLLWHDLWDTNANNYICVALNSAQQIYYSNVYVPTPLYQILADSSDSFARADGAIGSTDGLGHAEADSGAGKAWTNQVGTYTISSNAALSGTLVGSIGIATVDTGHADAVLSVKLSTYAGGNQGLVARWLGPTDYLRCYHDGTNLHVDRVLVGGTTSLLNVAATFAAGSLIHFFVDGDKFWAMYNEMTYTGSWNTTITAPTLLAQTVHGLYSTNAGNKFQNFIAFPRNGYADIGNI